jgi:hypothetical protein
MATLQDTFAQRQKESADRIGNLYNQQYESQAAQLKTAYDKNLSDAQAAQQKIAPQYQTQANNLATAYERNRRNLNMQNMVNGMGTGTAVQQQEALNDQFQRSYAGARNEEAAAQTAAGQKITDLGVDYRNQLNAARAESENKKAAALVSDMNTQNAWLDNQAKLMAGYGDFSAYENLYGKDAANQMRNVWIIQNPETALGAGLIDAARYKELTGRDAGTGPKG